MELCLNGACQSVVALDCSINNVAQINSCFNVPDANALTLDSRAAFTSTCDEALDLCTLNITATTHACDRDLCGAPKQSSSECLPSFMLDPNSCDCVKDPSATPTIILSAPLNNSLITFKNFTVSFDLINWSVQGKASTHAAFHINSVPGLSFSDELRFYNGNDSIVELNNNVGETLFASWIDQNTIQFNNVADGFHTIRGHLAYDDHTIPLNPEADTFITVFVNESKCISDSECNDNNICTNDYCDGTNDCQHSNIGQGEISCGVGACERTVDRCINGIEQACFPGSPSPVEICDLIDNNCNGQSDEGNACFVNMTISNPLDTIYSERRLPFDVQFSQKVDSFSILDETDKTPKEKILCRNCADYGHIRQRMVSFSEGFHNVTFKGTKESFFDIEIHSFFVDSIKPKIIKTEPKGKYATGNFSITFSEANPSSLTLNLTAGNDTQSIPFDLDECVDVMPLGSRQCKQNIDLEDYDGEEISYWFNLSDIAGHSTLSRLVNTKVDITSPAITQLNHSQNGKKTKFNITVSEKANLFILDQDDAHPRYGVLCNNCDSFSKERVYASGNHSLIIKAVDPAGNQGYDSLLLEI